MIPKETAQKSKRIALSKAKQKEYRESNRERIAAYKKAWRLANPDKVKTSKVKHEAKNDSVRKTAKRFKESNSSYTTDKNGRFYSRSEMVKIFNSLYKTNKDAILNIFPNLSRTAMHKRAREYRLVGTWRPWSDQEIAVLRRFWPDRAAIQFNLPTPRTRRSIDSQAGCLELTKKVPRGLKWTDGEDALLKSGLYPERRTHKSCERRLSALGLRLRDIKSARKMTGSEIQSLIRQAVPRNLPKHIREDAEANLVLAVMDGKVAPTHDAVSAAAKKAVTAVYKMHPDRGAPTSLDATLFDDSTTTVGDRISSETFHF